ncbi:hypothetical protein PR048_021773 [Dryococelus australis]|uniref:Brinker DNA-binding domain-containing protein n=1 Tax=Dryococelus australis TaxID=614101 RepID=A0ABQ9GZ81_9NEOP|nr:hypothetical protein PR048_021773 [Dryococelus australis]
MSPEVGVECTDQPPPKEPDDKKSTAISVLVRSKGEGKAVGSRRIFAPQFKLQVLDSYRRDADCRGNQRATARKYGIHRRQIQKWLQVEASLRTTVEDSRSQSPASPEHSALNLCAARQLDDSGAARVACQQADGEPEHERRPAHKEVRVSLFPTVKIEVTERHEDKDTSEYSDDDDYEDDMNDGTDHPLDFTCAALNKRRSFSLQFKLEVLDAFHNDVMCHGNQRATARKFGINRRQVQKWLGQEPELREEAAFRGGLYRQRLGRGVDCEDTKLQEYVQLPDPVPAHHSTEHKICSSDEKGWDLSIKKRKLDQDITPVITKRLRLEAEVPNARLDETDEVSSSGREVSQDLALCLVKDDKLSQPEVTSTVEVLGCKYGDDPTFFPAYRDPVVLPHHHHVPTCCVASPLDLCHVYSLYHGVGVGVFRECKCQHQSYPMDFKVDMYDYHYPQECLSHHQPHFPKWFSAEHYPTTPLTYR